MSNPLCRAPHVVHHVLSCSIALALAVASFGCDRGDDLEGEATRCPEPEATQARGDAAPTTSSVGTTAAAPATPASTPKIAPATPKVAASKPALDPAAAEQLRIKRLVIATGVADREPVGATGSLSLAEIDRVYAFVEVDNPLRGASEVVVTFEAPGGEATDSATTGNVRLDVGSAPRWRTWAYTRGIKRAGEWTAVVSTPAGKELARQTFTVTEA